MTLTAKEENVNLSSSPYATREKKKTQMSENTGWWEQISYKDQSPSHLQINNKSKFNI